MLKCNQFPRITMTLIYLFYEKLFTDNHHKCNQFPWITMKLICLFSKKLITNNGHDRLNFMSSMVILQNIKINLFTLSSYYYPILLNIGKTMYYDINIEK